MTDDDDLSSRTDVMTKVPDRLLYLIVGIDIEPSLIAIE